MDLDLFFWNLVILGFVGLILLASLLGTILSLQFCVREMVGYVSNGAIAVFIYMTICLRLSLGCS